MRYFESPRLWHTFVYGLFTIGGVLLFLLNEDPVPKGLGAGLTMLAGFTWAAATLNWIASEINARQHARSIWKNRTPASEVILAASSLTDEQAKIVPRLMYQTQIEVTIGREGQLGFLLATPGGSIPYVWIDDFFRKSTIQNLWPIRNEPDGTPRRRYAVAMTEWLCANGFAVEHNITRRSSGPHSAAWMHENSRSQARRVLHLDELITLQNNVNDESVMQAEEMPGPEKTT
jgi:hypothetical protein